MFWRLWRWTVLVVGTLSAASAAYFWAVTADGNPTLAATVSALVMVLGVFLFVSLLLVGGVARLARRQAK